MTHYVCSILGMSAHIYLDATPFRSTSMQFKDNVSISNVMQYQYEYQHGAQHL